MKCMLISHLVNMTFLQDLINHKRGKNTKSSLINLGMELRREIEKQRLSELN